MTAAALLDDDGTPPRAGPAARGVVGRSDELRRLDAVVDDLARPRSVVLVGEAGIGKTTLWRHAVERATRAGADVLVARPAAEERHHPGQGLADLFDPDGSAAPEGVLDPDVAPLDLCRLVLTALRGRAARGPVVVAVDDLPWLDDLTATCLRFALRRRGASPVTLLATARTWDPGTLSTTPLPALADGAELLTVGALGPRELRRVVADALPAVPAAVALRVGDLAHGNPFFAIELARTGAPDGDGSALAALARRVAALPPETVRLVRTLAVAGPWAVHDLAAAADVSDLDAALRPALDADVVLVDHEYVARFTHPLVGAAVLGTTHALDRRTLHASLARTATAPDVRALHLARASIDPDGAVAAEIETAAARVAVRGAPRLAADLYADSARLTPADDAAARVRRTLGQMMQRATAGDLPGALHLADTMLETLAPGPLRAEVITGRVVLDFTDAEEILRAALDDLPDAPADEQLRLLRGRLRGLLGWLLGLHLGRVEEGLAHARAGLAIGRERGDDVLVAQASTAVSTVALMAGHRDDALIEAAVPLGPEVVRSQLALWPRVLLGRQQLWDGHLADARANQELMYADAVRTGAEFQRPYRLADLALVALAEGDLDAVERLVGDGLEGAHDGGDARAVTWLAYPAGMVAALRGDADGAARHAERLDRWARRVGERPRAAMAALVRGTSASAAQDWAGALAQMLDAHRALDGMGIRHPGVVPALPVAVPLAALADEPALARSLAGELRRRAAALGSPWADAHAVAADGTVLLLDDDPAAASRLLEAVRRLERLGYRLEAARTAVLAVAAHLRAGRRRDVHDLAARTVATLTTARVRGWDAYATDLAHRVRGSSDATLTATEEEIVALVATGSRNREIARRLFVSESTVEAHLTRVYRKLGLRNRAELTRRVAATAPA